MARSGPERILLVGARGAGKTTILKAVAGLIEPVSGDIRLDGKSMAGVPPEKRNTIMVFQKPLLFPFMNVEQNIAFGLRMKGIAQREVRRAVQDILALTHLGGLDKRKVHELSGGQQQRVSLARALVLKPAVLLLDEPCAGMTSEEKQDMIFWIKDIQDDLGITILLIEHDMRMVMDMVEAVAFFIASGCTRWTVYCQEWSFFWPPVSRKPGARKKKRRFIECRRAVDRSR